MSFQFELDTTIFFRKKNDGLYQVVKLTIDSERKYPGAELLIKAPGWDKKFSLASLKKGKNSIDLDIPVLKRDTECKAILKADSSRVEKFMTLKAHRQWEVHFQNFAHTDIGYTDLPSRVKKSYVRAIKSIMRFCEETKDLDNDSKYRWNVETGYWLENAMNGLDKGELTRFKELVEEKRVEITPLYVAHTSEFNDEETLIRSIYFGFSFARECGVKIRTAMASDSTGQPWLFPQILSKSGVRYLSTAVNATMARAPKLPRPFYWESLDGCRILVLDTDERQAYQEGVMVGINESYEVARRKLAAYLLDLEEQGRYQFNLLALRNPGHLGDNTQPNINISYLVKKWNEKWVYPRLKVSTYTSFFEKFEKKYEDKIKTFSGAWPDWWVNYQGACAFETGVNRHTHTDIIEAERLSALLKIKNPKQYHYPKDELKDIYRKILIADEADWGSHSSVVDPDGLQAKGQMVESFSAVYQAAIDAKEIARNARGEMSKMAAPNTKMGIMVTNSLSWKRSDVVTVSIPLKLLEGKESVRIIDSERGKAILSQFIGNERQTGDLKIVFKAENIPALGFKVYDLIPENRENSRVDSIPKGNEIENRFYKVKYDLATGKIESIFDKELGRELIDEKSQYSWNQLIYESPEKPRVVDLGTHSGLPEDVLFLQPYSYDYPKKGEKLNRWPLYKQRFLRVKKGEIFTEIVAESSTYMCPKIIFHTILDNCFKRILIKNYIEKIETLDAEAVYCAFPFNLSNPKIRLNCHAGYFEPEKEQLPGSSKDWYCIQKWVDISNGEIDIVWSSVEAPLVQLGEINTGRWLDNININNGTIFSYIMNNYWWTNSPASQGGRYWFNYAITSRRPGFDPVYANRFGWSINVPLFATLIEDKKELAKYKAHSFLSDIPNNIMLVAIKRAEFQRGIVLRLIEIAGQRSRLDLEFSDRNIEKAYLVTPVEGEVSEINTSDGGIKVDFKPWEIITIKVEF